MNNKLKDYTGVTFGELTCIGIDESNRRKLICRCSCGNLGSFWLACLIEGRTKSCGSRHNHNNYISIKKPDYYIKNGKRFERASMCQTVQQKDEALDSLNKRMEERYGNMRIDKNDKKEKE